MGRQLEIIKGHGTENDFVIVPDLDGRLGGVLDAHVVQTLTDRFAGVGADGVIRVVRSAYEPEAAGYADEAEWFMDYRNADGSAAEMCGNGVRVLARYLFDHGLAATDSRVAVATRGGVRIVRRLGDGQYTVRMGQVTPIGEAGGPARVSMGGREWPAVALSVPNPHAVVFVDDRRDGRDGPDDVFAGVSGDDGQAQLDELGLFTAMPRLAPTEMFPDGANVEFVVAVGERHIRLRVWERGVGETRSCGTGVCAAAWAAMQRDGIWDQPYRVDVPGGRLWVTPLEDDELELTGPAVLGVRATVTL